jgi:hypothetical protein
MQIQAGSPQLQIQVAVEKKALDNVKEQGKQAVELIQSATPPPGTGTKLNVKA